MAESRSPSNSRRLPFKSISFSPRLILRLEKSISRSTLTCRSGGNSVAISTNRRSEKRVRESRELVTDPLWLAGSSRMAARREAALDTCLCPICPPCLSWSKEPSGNLVDPFQNDAAERLSRPPTVEGRWMRGCGLLTKGCRSVNKWAFFPPSSVWVVQVGRSAGSSSFCALLLGPVCPTDMLSLLLLCLSSREARLNPLSIKSWFHSSSTRGSMDPSIFELSATFSDCSPPILRSPILPDTLSILLLPLLRHSSRSSASLRKRSSSSSPSISTAARRALYGLLRVGCSVRRRLTNSGSIETQSVPSSNSSTLWSWSMDMDVSPVTTDSSSIMSSTCTSSGGSKIARYGNLDEMIFFLVRSLKVSSTFLCVFSTSMMVYRRFFVLKGCFMNFVAPPTARRCSAASCSLVSYRSTIEGMSAQARVSGA
mmetsp:Transcript_30589/g.65927  ORF Transcript_30589/g.65927 Transcript_30589/m.65927 type:complete len:427 (-) Transcript_30589:323-1603(-)